MWCPMMPWRVLYLLMGCRLPNDGAEGYLVPNDAFEGSLSVVAVSFAQ